MATAALKVSRARTRTRVHTEPEHLRIYLELLWIISVISEGALDAHVLLVRG